MSGDWAVNGAAMSDVTRRSDVELRTIPPHPLSPSPRRGEVGMPDGAPRGRGDSVVLSRAVLGRNVGWDGTVVKGGRYHTIATGYAP